MIFDLQLLEQCSLHQITESGKGCVKEGDVPLSSVPFSTEPNDWNDVRSCDCIRSVDRIFASHCWC
jgi:hypothetical protein